MSAHHPFQWCRSGCPIVAVKLRNSSPRRTYKSIRSFFCCSLFSGVLNEEKICKTTSQAWKLMPKTEIFCSRGFAWSLSVGWDFKIAVPNNSWALHSNSRVPLCWVTQRNLMHFMNTFNRVFNWLKLLSLMLSCGWFHRHCSGIKEISPLTYCPNLWILLRWNPLPPWHLN